MPRENIVAVLRNARRPQSLLLLRAERRHYIRGLGAKSGFSVFGFGTLATRSVLHVIHFPRKFILAIDFSIRNFFAPSMIARMRLNLARTQWMSEKKLREYRDSGFVVLPVMPRGTSPTIEISSSSSD